VTRGRGPSDGLSGVDVHGTALIMEVKTYGHYWLRCGEISRLLQVRCLVHDRVRSGPRVGGSPISVLCHYGRWFSLGSLPLPSILCIADLAFVYPAAVSPNFPHLIIIAFCVIEVYVDSVDIIRIFLQLICLDENLIGAGRPEEVLPNMGR
jgi:hypothetical protein